MTDMHPRQGEVIMLLDKEEMLRVCNIYLTYIFQKEERTGVEAIDIKPYRYGEKKETYYSIKLGKNERDTTDKTNNNLSG